MKVQRRRIPIYVTEEVYQALERRQIGTGATKNGLINMALDVFLNRKWSQAWGTGEEPTEYAPSSDPDKPRYTVKIIPLGGRNEQ